MQKSSHRCAVLITLFSHIFVGSLSSYLQSIAEFFSTGEPNPRKEIETNCPTYIVV